MTHDDPDAIELLLVDTDELFRLGMQTWLANRSDVRLVAEVATETEALSVLAEIADGNASVLAIVGEVASRFRLCQILHDRYPEVPVLLRGASLSSAQLTLARQAGVRGFCRLGMPTSELLEAIRQTATGGSYWPEALPVAETVSPPVPPPSIEQTVPPGVQYIDATLRQIDAQLRDLNTSLLDRVVLLGWRRELRAARWLVYQLRGRSHGRSSDSEPVGETVSPTSAVSRWQGATAEGTLVPVRDLQRLLFDTTLSKLQSRLLNLGDRPLEIDILSTEKKRELLATVLRKVDETSIYLYESSLSIEQLERKQSRIALDLWRETMLDFFGKYYTVDVDGQSVELVDVLLQDADVVREAFLDKIPLLSVLFAHLLFRAPLTIDKESFPFGSPEATLRAEYLLQNLLVSVANAVAQPLLNRFAGVDAIEQVFYDRRFLSTRDIERFRNELSWKYRWDKYVGEPKAIYESRFVLFVLAERGIKPIDIYAPRRTELGQLSGVRQAVTVALEGRDAVAPRLRAVVTFVGNGLVYLLTQVVGRGIGLIGRGILENLGGNRSKRPFGSSDSD